MVKSRNVFTLTLEILSKIFKTFVIINADILIFEKQFTALMFSAAAQKLHVEKKLDHFSTARHYSTLHISETVQGRQ